MRFVGHWFPAKVPVAYLRDRKPATAQLTVPDMLDALPLPPAPPATGRRVAQAGPDATML